MSRRSFISVLIIFCFSFFYLQPLKAQKLDFKQFIRKQLDSIYDPANDFGGATIGIVLPDRTVYEFAVGIADISQDTPMRPDHRMLGGSTGKIFVSTTMMQLVENGRIQLDDHLADYLGKHAWFSRLQNANTLRIRHLLQHSSGISRYVFEPEFQQEVKVNPDRKWVPEELLSFVFDKKPLFEAGSDFSYSDTNYIILGMVIETLTEDSLYNYVEQHILKPMGLDRVSPQVDREIPLLATGYSSDQDPFFPGTVVENGTYRYNVQFEWAGGGFVNNARDLARAAVMIYENDLFGKSLMDEYFKGIPATGLGGTWGLGVHIANSPIGTSFGHSGFFPGYVTNMLYFPDHRFSIAFQVNTSDGKKLSLYRKLHGLIPAIASYLNENR